MIIPSDQRLQPGGEISYKKMTIQDYVAQMQIPKAAEEANIFQESAGARESFNFMVRRVRSARRTLFGSAADGYPGWNQLAVVCWRATDLEGALVKWVSRSGI